MSTDNMDNATGTVTTLRTGRCGNRVPAGATDFYLLQNVQTGSAALLSLLFNGYRGYFAGTELPSSAEV